MFKNLIKKLLPKRIGMKFISTFDKFQQFLVKQLNRDDYNWSEYHQTYKNQISESEKENTRILSPKKFSIVNGKIILDPNLAPLHPMHKLLLETIYNLNPKSILEVGCGAGDYLVNIKKILPETEINGCDLLKKQLEFLDIRHPTLKKFANIFIHDVTTSFLNLKVELVYTVAVLMHIQRRHHYLNALRNIFHVSEKYVILSENWRRHNFYNDLKKIVNEPDFPWKNVNFYKVFSGETVLILISNNKLNDYEKLLDSREILELIY